MRTPLPLNTNPIITNLYDTAFLDSEASVIYVKGNIPTTNKQPTLTGDIFRQVNDTPLKVTHGSHLVILLKLPAYASKSSTLPGLMNNLLSLATLYDVGCTVTLEKCTTDMKF